MSTSTASSWLDCALDAYSWSTSVLGEKLSSTWGIWTGSIQQVPCTEPTQPIYQVVPSLDTEMAHHLVRSGGIFIRLAGLSGAAAVALGAYGAHSFTPEKQDLKKVYDTANFYHFVHTLALMGVPLCRRPVLTGCLLLGGMSIFCSTIYYHALTEEKQLRKFTPYGGMLLIAAWLSMMI